LLVRRFSIACSMPHGQAPSAVEAGLQQCHIYSQTISMLLLYLACPHRFTCAYMSSSISYCRN
jgi:hypothetical protein